MTAQSAAVAPAPIAARRRSGMFLGFGNVVAQGGHRVGPGPKALIIARRLDRSARSS